MEDNRETIQKAQPVKAAEYGLSEQESIHARRIHSRLVMTKAAYSDSLTKRDQLKAELEAMESQVAGQKSAVELLSMKASGWADGVALSRGDSEPDGFYIDLSNGNVRIVRG